MLKEATFISDLGIGDLINLSGAAVYLSQRYDRLTFPCREEQEISVRSMFALHPNIKVLMVTAKDENGNIPISPGEGDVLSTVCFLSGVPYDRSLSKWENDYASLRAPYSVRWDYCPIPEASKHVEQIGFPDCAYAFVHDDPARVFNIREEHISTGIKVIRPDPTTPNILSYCSLISRAAEGHYIDSSFRHLAESIPTSGSLFYHEYARPEISARMEPETQSRKEWVTFK
jgi:hypothetical protein